MVSQDLGRRVAGHVHDPRNQPHEADQTESYEKPPPSQVSDQTPAGECPERGADLRASIDERICKTTMVLREVARENLGIAWIRDGFACAQYKSHYEKAHEAGYQPRRGGCR